MNDRIEHILHQAVMEHQAGRLDNAQALYRRAIGIDPTNPDAHHLLGLLLEQKGHPQEGVISIRRAIQLNAHQPVFFSNLATLLYRHGELKEAAAALEQLLQLAPGDERSIDNLGNIYLELRQPEQALPHFARLVELAPDDPNRHMRLGGTLALVSRVIESEREFRIAARLAPEDAATHLALGQCLRIRRKMDEATACFRRALELDESLDEARFELANSLERMHQLDEARALAETVVRHNPQDLKAQRVLSRLDSRQGAFDDARKRLEGILADGAHHADAGTVLVELASVYDRLGEFDRAYEANARGQLLLADRPSAQQFPLRDKLEQIRALRDWVRDDPMKDWPRSLPDDVRPTPLFFVGFPRSGTTLTEQIIGAHPNLVTADELPMVSVIVREADRLTRGRAMFPHNLAGLTMEEIMRLREHYWQTVGHVLGLDVVGHRRLVDKLPLHLIKMPIIRRIYPDAKVLVGLRDPRDCCLSCFFQEFTPNDGMVHFFRLETTARLYAEVMGLWLEYRDKLHLDWMETRYEDLVTDFEGSARRIIDFFDEPWSDEVLAYREKGAEKVVSTPSYLAVREPIYKRASQRWRNYQIYLEPVMPLLEPFIREFGYDLE